ncbi:MAG: ZIP family metal transporter [Halobacteriaceae archaeon]
MLEEQFVRLAGENRVVQALVGGVVIALFNTLGAALVLVWRDPTVRALDGALGFAAGVMLSASFTGLILPGIDFASAVGYDAYAPVGVSLTGIYPVLVGFVLGVALLDRADAWVPHVHYVVTGGQRGDASPAGETVVEESRLSGLLLFIVAITLHNVPEGLAVGVAFGSGDLGNALGLMLAIGLQNVPEGLAVSVAAINAGLGRLFYAAVAGIRAGAVEIPVAVVGALAVASASPLLPYAMGFAAGGMLFVISDEIVPETHARGNERIATLGTMAGAVVMLYLDVILA